MFENKQKSQMTKWILAFVIFFCAILGTYVSLVSLIGFAIFAYIIVFCDSKISLFVIMFSMSFANIFKISPTAQSLFTYIMLGYAAYQIIMGRGCSTEFCVPFVLLLIFLCTQFLMSVHILRTIKFLVNFLFIYFALNDAIGREKEIFLGYIGGVVFASAAAWLGIIQNLERYLDNTFVIVDSASKARFSGMYSDPNFYSVNLIIALCLIVILYHKKELKPVTAILISLVLLFFVVMTYSKSAFFMLLIPVTLFLYCNNISGRYALQLVCGAGLVFFVIYAISGKIDFISTVLSRIQNAENLNQLTTGRTNIWKKYMDSLSQSLFHLLVGNGLGAKLVSGKAAHNSYIDFLHYLGIVGTFLIVHLLRVTSMEFNRRKSRRNYLNYSILIVILVMYFFLSELFYFDMPFHFLLAIMVLNMDIENPLSHQTARI